jgi:hypothetical protein
VRHRELHGVGRFPAASPAQKTGCALPATLSKDFDVREHNALTVFDLGTTMFT